MLFLVGRVQVYDRNVYCQESPVSVIQTLDIHALSNIIKVAVTQYAMPLAELSSVTAKRSVRLWIKGWGLSIVTNIFKRWTRTAPADERRETKSLY